MPPPTLNSEEPLIYAATGVAMHSQGMQQRAVLKPVHEPRDLPRCTAPASSNENEAGAGSRVAGFYPACD